MLAKTLAPIREAGETAKLAVILLAATLFFTLATFFMTLARRV